MLKTILSLLAIVLTFIGYYPYIRSVLAKKTHPHVYSWFIWTLDGFIIFALQITHGAGVGSFVVLSANLLSIAVLTLALMHKGNRDITRSDTIFSAVALLALVIWLFAKQPLISAILIMIVDLFGFFPTVRKSWYKPFSENVTFYAINTLRFAMTVAALQEYSLITLLYPSVWLVGNALFTLMLISRRKLA